MLLRDWMEDFQFEAKVILVSWNNFEDSHEHKINT